MYVVEVIPLKKGLQTETLTYFSAVSYTFGTIIEVPVRSKLAPAVVVSAVEASSAKTALRAATFSLRKLPPQKNPATIAPGLIATAKALHQEYPFALGTIMLALLPSEIKNGLQRFPQIFSGDPSLPDTQQPEVMMATRSDRYTYHKSLIRNTFAREQSSYCS